MTKKRCIFAGICLIIFIIIALAVSTGRGLAFDTVIREWFYSIRTPWLTEVVKAITFMGNTETIVVICILLLIKGRAGLQMTKKVGIPVAVLAIVGSAINKTIKHIMLRPRPDVSLHLIEQGGWSFPSGHSISSLLLYGFLAWLIYSYVNKGAGEPRCRLFANLSSGSGSVFAKINPGSGRLFANLSPGRQRLFANAAIIILNLLWIAVGLSRIYLGVHYPSDVLGGWMLGMVIMMSAIAVIEKKHVK